MSKYINDHYGEYIGFPVRCSASDNGVTFTMTIPEMIGWSVNEVAYHLDAFAGVVSDLHRGSFFRPCVYNEVCGVNLDPWAAA